MFANVVLQSWVFGSITLLILKSDEKTGDYREALAAFDRYSSLHGFDEELQTNLKTQLQLEFNNREVSDEQVLKNFPSSVRRKVLRKLYLPALERTSLMKGIRQQFVDIFLTSCSVETFSPGEDIIERGSVAADLFLLISGTAIVDDGDQNRSSTTTSSGRQQFQGGDFIGEIAFFTDSPQSESVVCVTVCKALTMTRETYRELSVDHPGSTGKIMQNLLTKVEGMTKDTPVRSYVAGNDAATTTKTLNDPSEQEKVAAYET
jgi:CRP-like cAMP-binding protein